MAFTNPIIIPPSESKIADKIWILSLTIEAPSNEVPTSIRARVAPYSSATKEVFKDKMQFLNVDDLFALAQTNTDVAIAANSLINALTKVCEQQNLFGNNPPPTPVIEPAPIVDSAPISDTTTPDSTISDTTVSDTTISDTTVSDPPVTL